MILSISSTFVKFLFLEIYVVPLSEVKQCLVFSPRTSGADLLLTQLILERPGYFQRISGFVFIVLLVTFSRKSWQQKHTNCTMLLSVSTPPAPWYVLYMEQYIYVYIILKLKGFTQHQKTQYLLNIKSILWWKNLIYINTIVRTFCRWWKFSFMNIKRVNISGWIFLPNHHFQYFLPYCLLPTNFSNICPMYIYVQSSNIFFFIDLRRPSQRKHPDN